LLLIQHFRDRLNGKSESLNHFNLVSPLFGRTFAANFKTLNLMIARQSDWTDRHLFVKTEQ